MPWPCPQNAHLGELLRRWPRYNINSKAPLDPMAVYLDWQRQGPKGCALEAQAML
jgi:hypothetical protein